MFLARETECWSARGKRTCVGEENTLIDCTHRSVPAKDSRDADVVCDAGAGGRADVCADGGLVDAGGEVRVGCVEVLGGEEAHEGVPGAREVRVGSEVRVWWTVGVVEGEEGRVGAGLLEGVDGCQDGSESDAVGERGEG